VEPTSFKIISDLGMQFATSKSKRKHHFYLVECPKCNSTYRTTNSQLLVRTSNKCKSCICKTKANAKKHGGITDKLYSVWTGIKKRCYSVGCKSYVDYGARGISVCELWKESYQNFKEWAISNGYEEHLLIDRRDNDGNYEPSNCRWVTKNTQARNTRRIMSTNTSGYRGVSLITGTKKYKAVIGVNNKNIQILRSFDARECAEAYDNYIKENNLEHTLNFK